MEFSACQQVHYYQADWVFSIKTKQWTLIQHVKMNQIDMKYKDCEEWQVRHTFRSACKVKDSFHAFCASLNSRRHWSLAWLADFFSNIISCFSSWFSLSFSYNSLRESLACVALQKMSPCHCDIYCKIKVHTTSRHFLIVSRFPRLNSALLDLAEKFKDDNVSDMVDWLGQMLTITKVLEPPPARK